MALTAAQLAAFEAATAITRAPKCARVEHEDGLAVFYDEAGNMLGFMNQGDYQAMKKREPNG